MQSIRFSSTLQFIKKYTKKSTFFNVHFDVYRKNSYKRSIYESVDERSLS